MSRQRNHRDHDKIFFDAVLDDEAEKVAEYLFPYYCTEEFISEILDNFGDAFPVGTIRNIVEFCVGEPKTFEVDIYGKNFDGNPILLHVAEQARLEVLDLFLAIPDFQLNQTNERGFFFILDCSSQ